MKTKRKRTTATAIAPSPASSIVDESMMIEGGEPQASSVSEQPTVTLPVLAPAAEAAAPSAAPIAVVAEAEPIPPQDLPLDPIVALPSNCTVKDASALQVELLKVLELTAPIALDGRAVERVDTATMQLLFAFVRDRGVRNLTVQWQGISPALLEAARLLGMQSALSLPGNGAA